MMSTAQKDSISSNKVLHNTIRRKKKLLSQGGQKWFKGSPRKNSSRSIPPGHLIQSSVLGNVGGAGIISFGETPPILPPLLVQFNWGDCERRLSVFDDLQLISVGEDEKSNDDVGSSGAHHHNKNRISKKHKLDLNEGNGQKSLEEGPEVKLPQPTFCEINEYALCEAPQLPNAYIRWMDKDLAEEEVEYDVDEEDSAWLDLFNRNSKGREVAPVSVQVLELLMDRLEKESYLQMQFSGVDQRPVIDDDAVCCICMDGECQNSNAILFCDMCNLAVHQECYGVPYIPEGQWLCRRCLQSPSRAVDCVLCPNKGGAFKQTDDGRWAHVVCAIWIPEVCFANTVFLEPVDSVNNIPPARWRLCCFICKYKGRGACIQCHKSNCYTAFHVTCAQYAGLCMKMETVRVGSGVTVRKTAYCDNHAPLDFIRSRDGDSPSIRQKLKACRKMLAEKRSAIPMVSIPTIPPERLSQISSFVAVPRKSQFLKYLLSYWKLKRIQRNGVPLLRRLQAASNHPPTTPSTGHSLASPIHAKTWQGEYKYVMRLRQDLERARLLCELIRKREKMKREFVHVREECWDLHSQPFTLLLRSVLDELAAKDTNEIFAYPVDPEEVPDYRNVITHPMDLSLIRNNVDNFMYYNVKAMEFDFNLMISNCLLYNSKDTMFYRVAQRLQESGKKIFHDAERLEASIGYDPRSGMHREIDPSNKTVTEDNFNNSVEKQEVATIVKLRPVRKSVDICSPKNKERRRSKRVTNKFSSGGEVNSIKRSEVSPTKTINNNNNTCAGDMINGLGLRNGPTSATDSFSKYRETEQNSSEGEEDVLSENSSITSDSSEDDSTSNETGEEGWSSDESSEELDTPRAVNVLDKSSLEPLHLVWAQGNWNQGNWSPALVIDPNMSPNFSQNGVSIPTPPASILARKPTSIRHQFHLVLFLNSNQTWEWKARDELEPLGVYPGIDKKRLEEGHKPNERRRLRRAYEKAILQHRQVAGAGIQRSDSDED